MSTAHYDAVIIGGGIVGLASALALSERLPDARLAVLEKESSLGAHQTARNSMVIHSGVYYAPGSLKARLCLEGKERLTAFCESHGIPWKRCSKVVVATSEADLPELHQLYQWGAANGVQGLELIGPERLKELEPHIRGVRAMYIPSAGAVNFLDVARTIGGELAARGVAVLTESRVVRIHRTDGVFQLDTGRGPVVARYLINCGGLHADRIARMVGAARRVHLIPFRILRFLLKPERRELIRSIVYPIPEPGSPQFGVHATRRFDGQVEVGPGIMLALAREGYQAWDIRPREVFEMLAYRGFWNMIITKWHAGMAELRRASSLTALVRDLQRIVPELTEQDLIREPDADGILAPAFSPEGRMLDDFCIEESRDAVHLLNAPSPAATAAFALGRHLAETAINSAILHECSVAREPSGV